MGIFFVQFLSIIAKFSPHFEKCIWKTSCNQCPFSYSPIPFWLQNRQWMIGDRLNDIPTNTFFTRVRAWLIACRAWCDIIHHQHSSQHNTPVFTDRSNVVYRSAFFFHGVVWPKNTHTLTQTDSRAQPRSAAECVEESKLGTLHAKASQARLQDRQNR